MQFRHRVMYDGLFTVAMRLATIVVALALGVLTARLLGPMGKGIYALPLVQSGLVSTLFAGLSSATSYFLLSAGAGRSIVRPSLLCGALFVAAAGVAVVPLAWVGHAWWAAPAAIASLPAVAVANFATGYVTGIKRIRYASSLTLVTTAFTFAFTAVGLFLVARSPFVAIVAWVVSSLFVAALALAIVLLHARRLPPGAPVEITAYRRMALKVGATTLVSLLNYRADLYLVAIMQPAFDLGLYTIATSAPQSLLLPTQAASQVASPHIGAMERPAAAHLTARCVRNNLLMATAICVVVFTLAPLIVHFFYGAVFLPLVPALRILLIGVIAFSLGGPMSSYYTLKLAKPEVPLAFAGISAAICIAGSIALIPHFGIEGAATASTVAYIVGTAMALHYFKRSSGISIRSMLVPTASDLHAYLDFVRRVWQDGTRLLSPRLSSTGK